MNDTLSNSITITLLIGILSFTTFACVRSEDENPNRLSIWTFIGFFSGVITLFVSAKCETPFSNWYAMRIPEMIAGFCFYGITGLTSVIFGGKSLMRIIFRTCGVYTAVPIRSNNRRTR